MTGENRLNGNGAYTERERALMQAIGETVRTKLDQVANKQPTHVLMDVPRDPPSLQYKVEMPAPEVSVINQVAAPVVNVEAPQVSVEAPTVNVSVDMGPVAEALEKLADAEAQEASRQERIVKALKLMGDQQQSLLSQLLQGQAMLTKALTALAEAVLKRPPIEVKPTIAVDLTPVARAVRQLKRRQSRTVTITHSDGTSSTLAEAP